MSVSSCRTPAARHIAASRRDDTIEFAKTQSAESGSTPPAAPRDSTCEPSSAPTSSPRSIRHPPGPGTATAHRSASGSLAITTSGEVCSASSSAASIAPGSSGLGKETVGNIGSGSACEATGIGAAKPAARNAWRTVSDPTPCSAVCTTVTSRGLSGSTTVRTSSR